jgi:hypothetical protein
MITPEQHRELQIRIETNDSEDSRLKVLAAIGCDNTDYITFKAEFNDFRF